MKINTIEVSGYQGVSQVSIQANAPILFIAGRNEAGKTSVADAIRHAFTKDAGRVKLKKDYKELVHDGMKKSIVSIEFERNGEVGAASVTLPAGTHHTDLELTEIHHCLLDFRRFSGLEANLRRSLVLALGGVRMSGKVISQKLMEYGVNAEKVKVIEPILMAGFAAAEKEAISRVSESRGGWKAVTGEAYGTEKAKEWAAKPVDFSQDELDAALAAMKLTADSSNAASQKLGMLTEKQLNRDNWEARRATTQETASKLSRAQAKLETDQAELAVREEALAKATESASGVRLIKPLECPHCAKQIEIVAGKPVPYIEPTKVADPDALAALPELNRLRDMVAGWVANDQRDLESCKLAAAMLENMDANVPEQLATGSISAAKDSLKLLDVELTKNHKAVTQLQNLLEASKSTQKVTADAAQHHQDLLQWQAIAEQLAPSGIQAKLLDKAMAPLLASLQDVADGTGFDLVTLDADMTIRIGGRPYSLGSQSAKWRADFAMTYALAILSGERFLMIDEVDVLDQPNKLAFLTYMHRAAGNLDTAILIATCKEPPQCPSTFHVTWIDSGTNVTEALPA